MATATSSRDTTARALWYVGPGVVELRQAPLPPLAPGEARVRTRFSGISRGTERLVLQGSVGRSEWERMRCPMQEGAFPFPVKYGYCAVGVVEDGPAEPQGPPRLLPAPPPGRAPGAGGPPGRRSPTGSRSAAPPWPPTWRPPSTRCGTAAPAPATASWWLAPGWSGSLSVCPRPPRLPGAAVTVVDVDTGRRPLAEALGAGFASPVRRPRRTPTWCSTPAPAPPVSTAAIACAGLEATVVEMSWYGDRPVEVGLGGAFHSRRLRLVSSQVGQVSPGRRPRWDYRRRMARRLAPPGPARPRPAGGRGDRLRGRPARAAAHPGTRRARSCPSHPLSQRLRGARVLKVRRARECSDTKGWDAEKAWMRSGLALRGRTSAIRATVSMAIGSSCRARRGFDDSAMTISDDIDGARVEQAMPEHRGGTSAEAGASHARYRAGPLYHVRGGRTSSL